MRLHLRVSVLVLFVLSSVGGVAFETAYFTTLRNGSDRSIDLDPDLESGHTHYTLAPGRTFTFLGGLSAVRFSIRTGQQLRRAHRNPCHARKIGALVGIGACPSEVNH